MQVVLVMFTATGERRKFPLDRDITVIGRREDCDLRIPLTEISRKHCRIVVSGETVRLEDMGSSNGTFHNGARISDDTELTAGDRIQIGPVIFTLQLNGVPADDEIMPPMVEDTSAGAGIESADEAEAGATGIAHSTSPVDDPPQQPTSVADEFAIAADDDVPQQEDDLIDLHPISPQDDHKKK